MSSLVNLDQHLIGKCLKELREIKELVEYAEANLEGKAKDEFLEEALAEVERLKKIMKELDNE